MTTQSYSMREVERMLGLSRAVVTGFIEAGFVTPARGKRREYRFNFQDLVIMKTARELSAANIGAKRIARSLQRLREQLPAQLPLAGLRISAAGNRKQQRLIVRQGRAQWQPDSGQYLLDFEVSPRAHAIGFLNPKPPAHASDDAQAWFARGCDLEERDWRKAAQAYTRAIELDATLAPAYINLGRLQHTQRDLTAAERTYINALERCEANALLLFNFGVLLEDMNRAQAALSAYRGALRLEPKFADAHYNLALLYQKQGASREALQHLNSYRRLRR